MKIPVFTDDPGWHGARLKAAFAKRDVDAVFVSLQSCVTELSGTASTVHIPTFDELPPAVFVRGVSGGSLQQIITRLNILHLLRTLGVVVYNDGKAIERTVDKTYTNFRLQAAGLSTPPTWVCESRHAAENIRLTASNQQISLLMKPLFGSQGLGVRQLASDEPLPVPMQQFVDGVYYFQQFIQTPDAPHDYRLFVINGKVVASMRRKGASWLNNVAAGGHCEAVEPSAEMVQMAEQAADLLEMHYAGVDIIQSITGEYYILEVNSIPAWRGLQRTTEQDLAQHLVDDFLTRIG